MSFYDSQNNDQWASAFDSSAPVPAHSFGATSQPPASQAFQGSSFGSSAPAFSSQPASQSPASPAFQGSSVGSAPTNSIQPTFETPASPAFQNAPVATPVIQQGAVPVIDEATLDNQYAKKGKATFSPSATNTVSKLRLVCLNAKSVCVPSVSFLELYFYG